MFQFPQLWNPLPEVYQQSAVTYTDAWQAYTAVLFGTTRTVQQHRAL